MSSKIDDDGPAFSQIGPRKLQMARRCQLLTGSYTGATRSCSCQQRSNCHLTALERFELQNHPKVLEALERNQIEFENWSLYEP